jgi:hypothetical protein
MDSILDNLKKSLKKIATDNTNLIINIIRFILTNPYILIGGGIIGILLYTDIIDWFSSNKIDTSLVINEPLSVKSTLKTPTQVKSPNQNLKNPININQELISKIKKRKIIVPFIK